MIDLSKKPDVSEQKAQTEAMNRRIKEYGRLSKAHTTSNNQNWETPKAFFRLVEKILGWKFTLDIAASDKNHLCKKYYTEENNAFMNLPWVPPKVPNNNQAVWCNPPYGDKKYPVREWVLEAWMQEIEHSTQNIAFLLPMNKMDQEWFHAILPHAWIGIVRGRIQFTIDGKPGKRLDKKTGKMVSSGNSQGSIIVAFGKNLKPGIDSIDWMTEKQLTEGLE